MRWDDATPYWINHARERGVLESTADRLFFRYSRGPRAARKLYWRLHQ